MKNILRIFFILWGTIRCQGYNFTKFADATGAFTSKTLDAYITYDSWRLLYYYNLTEFYDNVASYSDCLEKMASICDLMPERHQCESLLSKHKTMLANLHLDLEYMHDIQTSKQKQRRATPLGFLGTYLFKPAFGIMDEEDSVDISERINGLGGNQQLHTLILEHNLSLIKNTIKITNATFENFRFTVNKLHDYLVNITKDVNEMEHEISMHIDFKYLSATATLLIMEHQRTTHIIKRTLKNTLHGEFTELISYKQLSRDLLEVADNLDDTSTIMFVQDLKQLQEMINIQGSIIDKKLLVEIAIPILRRERYRVHNVVVLPMNHENKTVILDTESKSYLVNNSSRNYIPMRKEDMKNCKVLTNNKILCYPQAETYLESREICESNIIFEHDIETLMATCNINHVPNTNFIEPLTQNVYYIYVIKQMTVRENCPKKPSNFTTLKTTGILEMNPHCEIIINGMNIFAKNVLKREKTYPLFSPYAFHKISLKNLTFLSERETRLKLVPLKYITSNDDFSKLTQKTDEEINRLRTVKDVKRLEHNLLRNNSLLLVGIIILFIIVKFLLKKCC